MTNKHKNRKLILTASILLIFTFAILVALANRYSANQLKETVHEHAKVIAKSMWDITPHTITDYLRLAADQNSYRQVVITDEQGNIFTSINGPELSGIDRPLLALGVIGQEKYKTAITYQGNRLGVIEVEWYRKTIYDTIYIFLILFLVTAVIWTYLLLRRSETEYRSLYEASLVGMWKIDIATGRFIKANRATQELLETDHQELLSKFFLNDFIPKENRKILLDELRRNAQLFDYEIPITLPNGIIKEVSISAIYFKSDQCIEGTVIDITERKRSEEALHKARRMRQLVLDTIPQSIYWKNLRGDYLGCNQQFAEDVGIDNPLDISITQIQILQLDQNIEKHFSESDAAILLSQEPVVHAIEKVIDKNDHEKWFDRSVLPLFNLYEEISGVLCIYEDITERKLESAKTEQLERELLRAQKLESIGTLAAGVAHEINTPIQFIRDNTIFIKENVSELIEYINKQNRMIIDIADDNQHSVLKEHLKLLEEEYDFEFIREELPISADQSLEGIDRVAEIVSAMKGFSHMGSENLTEEDINKAIESTIAVSRNEWKYIAEMQTDLDSSLPLVCCYIGEIKQVILNIIINAAHAIQNIQTETDLISRVIHISTYRENDSIVICIKDNGSGIPTHIQDKIFDPFFTTKEVGKGTGQGLSLAYQTITEKHQGRLTFDSQDGVGTSFYITLPLKISVTPRD
ncbi:MAG: ATP-binding protein [Sedimenticola sp.]|nr:ATP-binding protein [Sedimenticola sp.]